MIKSRCTRIRCLFFLCKKSVCVCAFLLFRCFLLMLCVLLSKWQSWIFYYLVTSNHSNENWRIVIHGIRMGWNGMEWFVPAKNVPSGDGISAMRSTRNAIYRVFWRWIRFGMYEVLCCDEKAWNWLDSIWCVNFIHQGDEEKTLIWFFKAVRGRDGNNWCGIRLLWQFLDILLL